MPSIARIERELVVTVASWRARACFLVWAPSRPGSSARLDAGAPASTSSSVEVVALARATGLDPERPLPFRVRATAVDATLHVLDKRDGLPHNPERHEQAKVRRTLEHTAVELVGFYSRQHRGIFTPKESNVHVHLRTEDGRISGHLEAIRLAPGGAACGPRGGFDRATSSQQEGERTCD